MFINLPSVQLCNNSSYSVKPVCFNEAAQPRNIISKKLPLNPAVAQSAVKLVCEILTLDHYEDNQLRLSLKKVLMLSLVFSHHIQLPCVSIAIHLRYICLGTGESTISYDCETSSACLQACHHDATFSFLVKIRDDAFAACLPCIDCYSFNEELLSTIASRSSCKPCQAQVPVEPVSEKRSKARRSPWIIGSSRERAANPSAIVKRRTRPVSHLVEDATTPRLISELKCAKQEGRSCIETLRFTSHSPLHFSCVQCSSRRDTPHFDLAKVATLLHGSSYCRSLAEAHRAIENRDSLGLAHFVAGISCFHLAQYSRARRHFQECLAIVKGDHPSLYVIESHLGDVEFACKRFPEAACHYKKAIELHSLKETLATELQMAPPSLSLILIRYGLSLQHSLKIHEAICQYKKALKRSKSNLDRLLAFMHLSCIHLYTGDINRALRECNEALNLAIKVGDVVLLSRAHGNIGNVHLAMQEMNKARDHYEKSLQFTKVFEYTPSALSHAYNKLGNVSLSINDCEKAKEYYDLALCYATYGVDIPGMTQAYMNIGNVHRLCRNFKQAILCYEKALGLSKNPLVITACQHSIGCTAFQLISAQKIDPPSPFSVRRGFFNTMTMCLQSLHDQIQSSPVSTLGSLAMLKQCLSEVLAEIREAGDHETLGMDQALASGNLSSCLLICLESTKYIEEILINEDNLDGALKISALRRALTFVNQELKGSLDGTILLDRESLSNLSKHMACPVVYLSTTHTLLISRVFFHHHSKVTIHRKSLCDVGHSEGSQPLQCCFQEPENRICPIQLKLNVIAPSLRSFLIDFSSNEVYMKGVVLCDVEFLPVRFHINLNSGDCVKGAHVSMDSNQVSVPLPVHVCAIGNPKIPPFIVNDHVETLGELPHAQEEVSFVSHIFSERPLLKEEATKQSFLLHLQRSSVIHIATHGSDGSSLAFAPFGRPVKYDHKDGSDEHVPAVSVLVYPEDIQDLRISPALVVLSSCDSGREAGKAHSTQGMARAFKQAGATTVLSTQWKINDESASAFMQFFYQFLMDGFLTSVAYDKTILCMHCFTQYREPVHWNGFQLTGRDVRFQTRASTVKDRLPLFSALHAIDSLENLKKYLLKDPVHPTDVQVIIIILLFILD